MTKSEPHARDVEIARKLYLNANEPSASAIKWREHLRIARMQVRNSLRASNRLRKIAEALESDGAHAVVYRQILMPPLSQDQFKLLCPAWSKGSENDGRPLAAKTAAEVAAVFEERMDYALASGLITSS